MGDGKFDAHLEAEDFGRLDAAAAHVFDSSDGF